MDDSVIVGALGPVELRGRHGPVSLRGRVERTLIARLALQAGGTVPREALIDSLWGPAPPRTAATTLRSHLTRLRHDLRDGGVPELIGTRSQGYALLVPPEAVDAVRFETLSSKGRELLAARDPAAAAAILRSALGLWRGEMLTDCRGGDWLRAQAARLGELRATATEQLMTAKLAIGEHATAVADLEEWVIRFPFQERLWELLMLALYRSGRQADALAAFRRARTALVAELGIEPGPELRRLEAAVLARDPRLDTATGQDGSEPPVAAGTSPGTTARTAAGAEPVHTAPVRTETVGAQAVGTEADTEAGGTVPADTQAAGTRASLPERPTGTGNLPAETTSFVGRAAELARTRQLLAEARLVTLTGVGGVGKSRLAVRAAAAIEPAVPDGVWLVELAGLRDPNLVAVTVAETLRILDWADGGATDSLVKHLRESRALLILDNCEHLLNACAELAETLLRAAGGLRIVVTSRQPLGVPGEHILPVPPLLNPRDDGFREPPGAEAPAAVQLFADRATAVVPGGLSAHPEQEATVRRICQQLDGIPLAIELAAVRLRVLSPEQLLDRLDRRLELLAAGGRTALPRHQTLRAAIDVSFNLCTRQERAMWACLSVFAGNFDLQAAAAVTAGHEAIPGDVLPILDGLVDKSILIREEHHGVVRFRLLATLQEYGRERLRECGLELETLRRHRDWFLHLAGLCEADWFGPRQLEWLIRLRLSHADLRAALTFCLTTPDEADAGLRLAACLHVFWVGCEFVSEGWHWLDRALALGTAPTRARTHALWVSGRVTYLQGKTTAGIARLEESRELARRLDDGASLACATHLLGSAALVCDEPERAEGHLRDAIDHYGALHRADVLSVMATVHLAMANVLLGEADEAIRLCHAALATCEQHGERWTRSYALYVLAFAEWAAGAADRAAGHALEALRVKSLFRETIGITMTVDLLAWIVSDLGEHRRAATLLGAARASWASIGVPWFGSASWRAPHERAEDRIRWAIGDAECEEGLRDGAGLALDQAVALALGDGGPGRDTTPRPAGRAAAGVAGPFVTIASRR